MEHRYGDPPPIKRQVAAAPIHRDGRTANIVVAGLLFFVQHREKRELPGSVRGLLVRVEMLLESSGVEQILVVIGCASCFDQVFQGNNARFDISQPYFCAA